MVNTIKNYQKIELHRHLEGCITPTFLKSFVQSHHPDHELVDSNRVDQLFSYTNFMDFLQAWGTVMGLLTEPEHFRDIAKYAIQQMKGENIVYAELIFSPQPFDNIGLDTGMILEIIYEEFAKSSLPTNLIIDLVRNFGATSCQSYFDKLVEIRKENDDLANWIRGISIGGDEVNFAASLFIPTFKQAKSEGFHLYAHAGEWVGAESVWSALTELGVERIGHGIRSVDDANLIRHLKSSRIGLDISITSNYLTNALDSNQIHPVGDLYREGVPISLNTDDPGFFHTDLNQEYRRFVDMGFSFEDLEKIRHQSLSMTFLDDDERENLRKIFV